MKRAPRLALAIGLLQSLPAVVLATSTADPDRCAAGEFEFCLNGVTSGVVGRDAIRMTGARVDGALKERERENTGNATAQTGLAGQTGMAAGELGSGFGVWASYNFSDFESENGIAPYDGTMHSVLFGVDRMLTDRLLFGISGGYERSSTDTFYNGGGGDGDGYTIAPYAAWLINDTFSVDAGGGYTTLDYEQDRIASNNGARLAAEYDADRWFAMANVNAIHTAGNATLGAHTGILWSQETHDAYVETGASTQIRTVGERLLGITQFSAGADAGYSLGSFEPYGLVNYRHDLAQLRGLAAGGLPAGTGATQSDDRDEFEAGIGVRYFGGRGLTGALEWLATLGREEFDNHSLMLTLRLDL